MVWTKNLSTFRRFRRSFTVILRSKLGVHTFVIGSRNITTATIELLKNLIYMTPKFQIVNIHKYQKIFEFFCPFVKLIYPYIYIPLHISIFISMNIIYIYIYIYKNKVNGKAAKFVSKNNWTNDGFCPKASSG